MIFEPLDLKRERKKLGFVRKGKRPAFKANRVDDKRILYRFKSDDCCAAAVAITLVS